MSEEIQTLRFLKGKTVRDFFGAVFTCLSGLEDAHTDILFPRATG